jgi:hypothetical protein
MELFGVFSILAAGGIEIGVPTGLDSDSRHMLGGAYPVIIAILILLGGLVVWAVFIRKPARRRDRGRVIATTAAPAPDDDSSGSSSQRRRRRRRGRNRGRNPTLADTGGLPPIGSGDPKSPSL